MARPARAVLPMPPTPVSATPAQSPTRSRSAGVPRSAAIVVRRSARRPIRAPTGSSLTPVPVRWAGRATQRLRGQARGAQRKVVPGGQQGGHGELVGYRGAVAACLLTAIGRHGPSGVGEGLGGGRVGVAGEGAVEAVGEGGGEAVGDRGLHRHHPVRAAADQRRRESVDPCGRAGAAGEHHHRQRVRPGP